MPVETKHRPVDVRSFCPNTDIIRKIARGEIVRTIDHEIVTTNELLRVLACELSFVHFQRDVRICFVQSFPGRISFFSTDVACSVKDLPLQVG